MNLIWIWAGNQSRLFHRYMAANWAGKLKSSQKFYDFKYEVIKQGKEPREFSIILEEIKENKSDIDFPGQSRGDIEKSKGIQVISLKNSNSQDFHNYVSQTGLNMPKIERTRILSILSEIKEIQKHVKYSIEHVEQRIKELENILKK